MTKTHAKVVWKFMVKISGKNVHNETLTNFDILVFQTERMYAIMDIHLWLKYVMGELPLNFHMYTFGNNMVGYKNVLSMLRLFCVSFEILLTVNVMIINFVHILKLNMAPCFCRGSFINSNMVDALQCKCFSWTIVWTLPDKCVTIFELVENIAAGWRTCTLYVSSAIGFTNLTWILKLCRAWL